MEHFEAERALKYIERYGVTHSQWVPTMFVRMLKLPEDVRTKYDVSSLKCAIHAAAPCPIPVKEQMIDWWGPIIHEYYGATEGLGFTACDSEEWLAHRGTVGKVVLGTIHIMDDAMQELPAGTPGTIWFETATPFEYYNDPQKTREATSPDGTMTTVNDVGYVDDDGFLYLTDRKTFMIISGGVNIYPQETENLLITHPKVADAAVFGVPNVDLGEEVKAVVQLMPGIEPGPEVEQELIAFCHQHLSARSSRAAWTSRTSSRACPPASSTSGCCGTATGATTSPASSDPAGVLTELSRSSDEGPHLAGVHWSPWPSCCGSSPGRPGSSPSS
jgi:long-chain acyl-CoA synthetase